MKQFTVEPNEYLKQKIQAFYHADYTGMGNSKNPDYIDFLKNTFNNYEQTKLDNSVEALKKMLLEDLPQILQILKINSLTICTVPRAKKEGEYHKNQLLFRTTIGDLARCSENFEDGTGYIIRNTDTKTTHLQKAITENRIFNYNNYGDLPYPGITKETCNISDDVKEKDILLVDDIYTKTVNIDEDAIQALLDKGAKSVVFYAIGKTVEKFKN